MNGQYRSASAEGYPSPTESAAIARAAHPLIQRFTIPGRLAGMNEYQRACRAHWRTGHGMKIEQQEIVEWSIKTARLKQFPGPVSVRIHWIERDRRRDFDNITAASKWVMDALVRTGIIPGDGERWVKGIVHERGLDRGNPRVEVEIREAAP